MAKYILYVMFLVCLTGCASTAVDVKQDISDAVISGDRDNKELVATVSTAFNEAMVKCPERVWPDYNWRNLDVILFDSAKQQAFRWTGSDGTRAEMIDFGSVAPRLVQGAYAYNLPGEKPLMALSLNSQGTLYGLIGLGIHEAFHQFGQVGWPSLLQGEDQRFTPYPQNHMPRYLRYAVSRLLLDFLDTGNPARLSEARDVWDRYRRDFKNEADAIAYTDIEEGTARYVEVMGTTVSTLGCSADYKTMYARYRTFLLQTVGGEFRIIPGASLESYTIGALASLALHNDMSHKGWEMRVINGDTPLAILLEKVSPEPAPEFSDKLVEAESTINRWNEDRRPVVETFRQNALSDKYYAFAIPENRRMGSYNATGQIKDIATGWKLITDFSVSFPDRQSPALIKLNGLTVREEESSPCTSAKEDTFIFYLPQDQVNIESGQQLSFTGGVVSGDKISYQEVRDSGGKKWFCL